MSAGLIFITGATGFVGTTIALNALSANYNLRISVRQASQIALVKRTLKTSPERLEFVVVPDITDPTCFAGKLDGADYVIHVASPYIHNGTEKAAVFGPAVKGTMAILEEAKRVDSVKKVVITSSAAALLPVDYVTSLPQETVIDGT